KFMSRKKHIETKMLLETEDIPLNVIDGNEGQIEGLPANPRTVKNGKFRKLMQSIKDRPDMLHLREIIVFPYKTGGQRRFVAIAGNQRRAACIELGHHSIRCKVLHPETPVDNLKAIAVLDNTHAGDWDMDMLANEGWDVTELRDWNIDIPDDWGDEESFGEETADQPAGKPVVKMEILFDDLDYYQHCKDRLKEILR